MRGKNKKRRHFTIGQKIMLVFDGIVALIFCFLLGVYIYQFLGPRYTLEYDGQTYVEKALVTNVLVLGIDKHEDLVNETGLAGDNGQADFICLVSIDWDDFRIKVTSIPRETMADVEHHTVDGNYKEIVNEQVCLQYAFGLDAKEGCQLMADRVEEITGLHVDYSCAFSMGMIEKLVDTIGGVDVTMTQDHTIPDLALFWGTAYDIAGNETDIAMKTYYAGETAHLDGEEAYEFVHYRDIINNSTNLDRMARQKDFLAAFIPQLKSRVRADYSLPRTLLGQLKDYVYYDISVPEMLPLALAALECQLDTQDFYRLPGDDIHVDEHDQFVVDQETWTQHLVEEFYTVK